MLDIQLKTSHYYHQTTCFLCGQNFYLEGVDAAAYREGEKLGDVCEECIRKGETEMPNTLMKRADDLRREAELLENLSNEGISAPTWEEFKFKEDAGV